MNGFAKAAAVITAICVSIIPSITHVKRANGYFALYSDSAGTVMIEEGLASSFAKSVCYQVAPLGNNLTKYIKNHTNSYFYVFDNGSCSSTPGTIYPNSVGAMTGVWYNTISSFYRAT
jgi:hypothetical protein